jgi:hypothetical protein
MKGPVASMVLNRNTQKDLVKKLRELDRLEDISVDLWIILKRILKNKDDSSGSENKPVSDSFEFINNLARFINDCGIADIFSQNQPHKI